MRLFKFSPISFGLVALCSHALSVDVVAPNETYIGSPRHMLDPVQPMMVMEEQYINAQTNTYRDVGSAFAMDPQCSADKPCLDGSCCNQQGHCGYRPEHCHSSCVSNCNASAPCGEHSEGGVKACPLGLCCSYFGVCGVSDTFCRDVTTSGQFTPCQSKFGNCGGTQQPTCGNDSGTASRRIGYHEAWNSRRAPCDKKLPKDLDTTGFTHLVLAFASIDPETYAIREMHPDEEEVYSSFVARPDGIPKFLGVGGWEFSSPGPTRKTWSQMASTKESRSMFINSLNQFLSKWQFRGVDLHWQWPGAESRGGDPAIDTQNLVALMTELRQSLGTNFGVSIALPAQYEYLKYMNPKAIEAHVDWFNVLTYDLHGPWDAGVTGFGNKIMPHTDLQEIDQSLQFLWSSNIEPSKVNLGIANYGRGYTVADKSCMSYGCTFTGPSRPGECTLMDGILSRCEIERRIKANGLSPTIIAGGAGVKQITWDDQWIAYDDDETLLLKTQLANNRCLGGTALWALSYGACDKNPFELPASASITNTPQSSTQLSASSALQTLPVMPDVSQGSTTVSSAGLPTSISQSLWLPTTQIPGILSSSTQPSTMFASETFLVPPSSKNTFTMWSSGTLPLPTFTSEPSTELSTMSLSETSLVTATSTDLLIPSSPGSSLFSDDLTETSFQTVIESITSSSSDASAPPSTVPLPSQVSSTSHIESQMSGGFKTTSQVPLQTSMLSAPSSGILSLETSSIGRSSSQSTTLFGPSTALGESSTQGTTETGSSVSISGPLLTPTSLISPSPSLPTPQWPSSSDLPAFSSNSTVALQTSPFPASSQTTAPLPVWSTDSTASLMVPTSLATDSSLVTSALPWPVMSTMTGTDGLLQTLPTLSQASLTNAFDSSISVSPISSSHSGSSNSWFPSPTTTVTTIGSPVISVVSSTSTPLATTGGSPSSVVPSSVLDTTNGLTSSPTTNDESSMATNPILAPSSSEDVDVFPSWVSSSRIATASDDLLTTSAPASQLHSSGVLDSPSSVGASSMLSTTDQLGLPVPTSISLPSETTGPLTSPQQPISSAPTDTSPAPTGGPSKCVPRDCIKECFVQRLLTFITVKRPVCVCIPKTCDGDDTDHENDDHSHSDSGDDCSLLGCGCGWMGLPFGPGCGDNSIDLDMPMLGLGCGIFGCKGACHLFGGCLPTGILPTPPIPGPTPPPTSDCGPLGCGGYCNIPGGCKPCPPQICGGPQCTKPGGCGPSPGPMPPSLRPTDKPDPEKCEEADKKTVTERFVVCTEGIEIKPTTIASINFTVSETITSTCVPLYEATLTACGIIGWTSTTTATSFTSSEAPACTRAPLSLDEDEGDNQQDDEPASTCTLAPLSVNEDEGDNARPFQQEPTCTRAPLLFDEDEGDNSRPSEDAPTCTRAPLLVDDDEGDNEKVNQPSPSSSLSGSLTSTTSTPSASPSNCDWPRCDCCADHFRKCTESDCKPDGSDAANCAKSCLVQLCINPLWPHACSTGLCRWKACGPKDGIPSVDFSTVLSLASTTVQITLTATPSITATSSMTTTSAPAVTSIMTTPKCTSGPIRRDSQWSASLVYSKNDDGGQLTWALFDPNGCHAGAGQTDGLSVETGLRPPFLSTDIHSTNRPEYQSMQYWLDTHVSDMTSPKATTSFTFMREVADCKASCFPSFEITDYSSKDPMRITNDCSKECGRSAITGNDVGWMREKEIVWCWWRMPYTPGPYIDPPLPKVATWRIKIHQEMEYEHGIVDWTLIDPNGYEAGSGRVETHDGSREIEGEIVSSPNRPSFHSLGHNIRLVVHNPTWEVSTWMSFEFQKNGPNCRPCYPKLSTNSDRAMKGHRPNPVKPQWTYVATCGLKCPGPLIDKENTNCLFSGEPFKPKNAGRERDIDCWFQSY